MFMSLGGLRLLFESEKKMVFQGPRGRARGWGMGWRWRCNGYGLSKNYIYFCILHQRMGTCDQSR